MDRQVGAAAASDCEIREVNLRSVVLTAQEVLSPSRLTRGGGEWIVGSRNGLQPLSEPPLKLIIMQCNTENVIALTQLRSNIMKNP